MKLPLCSCTRLGEESTEVRRLSPSRRPCHWGASAVRVNRMDVRPRSRRSRGNRCPPAVAKSASWTAAAGTVIKAAVCRVVCFLCPLSMLINFCCVWRQNCVFWSPVLFVIFFWFVTNCHNWICIKTLLVVICKLSDCNWDFTFSSPDTVTVLH